MPTAASVSISFRFPVSTNSFMECSPGCHGYLCGLAHVGRREPVVDRLHDVYIHAPRYRAGIDMLRRDDRRVRKLEQCVITGLAAQDEVTAKILFAVGL